MKTEAHGGHTLVISHIFLIKIGLSYELATAYAPKCKPAFTPTFPRSLTTDEIDQTFRFFFTM
jgi:hypothetical protein